MYFQCGGLRHPDGAVALSSYSIASAYDPRGNRRIETRTLQVTGVLEGETQAEITAQIKAVEAAYRDGADAALYQSSGQKTPHEIRSSGSLTGSRITNLSYPIGEGNEYANQRTFQATIEADYDVVSRGGAAADIVAWEETISTSGSGGPRFVILEPLNGPPIRQLVNQATAMRITQAGRAIGRTRYPTIPQPLFPLNEDPDGRSLAMMHPRYEGKRHVDYPIRWQYRFLSEYPVSLPAPRLT